MYISQLTVDRIKELREEKGISATELNKVCNLSKNTIATSANSKNGLSAKILFDVAKFLECSVDYLLGTTDNPNLVAESYYINGDNNGIQSNKGTVSMPNNHKADIIEDFMQAFEELDFSDKIEVMSFAMQKKKKEEE